MIRAVLLLGTMSLASGLATVSPVQPMPARVVPSTLPKLYVADHCPFCVRVRLALGLKNVKHTVEFLANDDAKTPTDLVGKKIYPIWVEDGKDPMPESMDIIKAVDADEAYGPTGFFKPDSGRTDLKAWQKKFQRHMRILQRPRYVHDQSVLPEFQQRDARDYFIKGHFVPVRDDLDKAAWKEMSFEEMEECYAQAMGMTDELVAEVNEGLKELDEMIYSEDCCTEGGLSYDDIDLWARMRSITIVKGVKVPEKLAKYQENLSRKGDVPLYWSCAI